MFSLKSDEGIFYGWWILIGSSFLTFYGAGTFFYGFTVFVHPMVRDLGWSMTLVSGAFSLYRLESGVAAPLAGYLLDRMGPRILVAAGALIWGAGLVYLSRVTTIFHFYAAFFVISFGWTFASGAAVPTAMIAKWFIRKRGRALGIYTSVSGLSGLFAPVLAYLIEIYGWQHTLLLTGFITWLSIIPLAVTLRHKPEDHGLLPDGIAVRSSPPSPEADAASANFESDFSVKKAILTPAFWFLVLISITFQMTMSPLFVHLVPHLVTSGISTRVASLAVTFITLCSVLGRAGFGWLSDMFNKKWLLLCTFLLQAIGLFAFSQVRSVVHLIPFLLAYAPSYGGSIAVRPAIVGEYFGRKNFGTIYGVLLGSGVFGGISGPIIAGYVYDVYGNFRPAFMMFALFSLISALLLFFMKRPRLASETIEHE